MGPALGPHWRTAFAGGGSRPAGARTEPSAFVTVWGAPVEGSKEGITWDGEPVPDLLAPADRRATGFIRGFTAPLPPSPHRVMGKPTRKCTRLNPNEQI